MLEWAKKVEPHHRYAALSGPEMVGTATLIGFAISFTLECDGLVVDVTQARLCVFQCIEAFDNSTAPDTKHSMNSKNNIKKNSQSENTTLEVIRIVRVSK